MDTGREKFALLSKFSVRVTCKVPQMVWCVSMGVSGNDNAHRLSEAGGYWTQ